MAAASTCPLCGAPAAPFAAGCVYCGADLEDARGAAGPPPLRRVREVIRLVASCRRSALRRRGGRRRPPDAKRR
jgi:hypothetical protein